MRLLLDTQVALWWLIGSKRLDPASRRLIGAADCHVSVASVWEVAIKHGLRRLPVAPASFRDELVEAGVTLLAVDDRHAIASSELPTAHADPFDRLLLATAVFEGLRLLTADRALVELAARDKSLPIIPA
ncbi:MAG: type II toxin-antitoxin system VapC family toxin [Alphaproteobacteria bacterium]